MKKVTKLKNNKYLSTETIAHNNELLSTILNKIFNKIVIIETITNENGTAIKFSDGTMICRCCASQKGGTKVKLPLAFISIGYSITFGCGYATSPNVVLTWGNKTSDSFYIFVVKDGVENETDLQAFDYTAIGRWK